MRGCAGYDHWKRNHGDKTMLVKQRVLFKDLKKKGVAPKLNGSNHWKCKHGDKTVNISNRGEYHGGIVKHLYRELGI